ncbi:benzoate-CoA ligase family protein [Fodinicola acaciae]|uniref:benzoate-CoA ligase family protein n=1 Tax=Fodinicola acaciae TaxID=2681555 RepID=UPI0013D20C0D|nr:benzoate-CoA ligase family protein [Fodinicola acaciae]
MTRFNISTLVDRNLSAGRADKVAIQAGDEQVTYAELHARVCAAGSALTHLGVRREQRVLLILDDSPDFPAVFLGAARIGAVPVPVNPALNIDDYRFFLADSYAEIAVVEAARFEQLAPVLAEAGVRAVVAGGEGELALAELMASHAGEIPPLDTHAEDMAFWLYSSGSTGRPKGVVHSHGDLLVTCETYADKVLRITEDDVTFSSTKLYHAYGMGNGMSFPYWAGGSSVLMRGRPKPEAVLDTAERFRPTLFFSVPTLYNAMLRVDKRDLSSVRLCASAAEPLPAGIWQRWHDTYGLTILDGIGSTEMLHIYCSNTETKLRPGSSGKPVPGYEVKLVGMDGGPVGVDEPGNLYAKGASALDFYWHRREKTRQALHGEWFFTGDRYTRDADGFFWYSGRADDMMKIGGLWVSPIEIENALIDHPLVAEVAIVAVSVDGLARIKAFVVLQEAQPSDALVVDLQEWCKKRLQRYQFPHFVEFTADLPKTATGKIQRFKLRDAAS